MPSLTACSCPVFIYAVITLLLSSSYSNLVNSLSRFIFQVLDLLQFTCWLSNKMAPNQSICQGSDGRKFNCFLPNETNVRHVTCNQYTVEDKLVPQLHPCHLCNCTMMKVESQGTRSPQCWGFSFIQEEFCSPTNYEGWNMDVSDCAHHILPNRCHP